MMKTLLFCVCMALCDAVVGPTRCGSSREYNRIRPDRVFPDSKLVSMKYVIQGTMATPDYDASLSLQPDGRYLARKATFGQNDSVYCDSGVADMVCNRLRSGKIMNYNGEYFTNQNVLDGTTWLVEVTFGNGVSVRSGGHMAYPKDFSAVKGFVAIIDSLLP